jgi:BioD-like phosphotransacetylase family protein
MSVNSQANYNNMLVSSRHEWIRSTLLNVSLLGKPTKSEEEKNVDELEFQHISLHEVIPYILISQHGSKPRKQFQARTSYRRDWERREQSYRQEKLIETVQRKRILELRSTFSDEVQRAMGILHVQSLLLQKLAREENKATEHSRANFESSLTEETNPQLATISDLQDLLRDVGSAVATLWV